MYFFAVLPAMEHRCPPSIAPFDVIKGASAECIEHIFSRHVWFTGIGDIHFGSNIAVALYCGRGGRSWGDGRRAAGTIPTRLRLWAALDVNDAIVGVKLGAHRHGGDHRNRRIAHGVLGAPVGGVGAAASGR